MKRKLLLGVLLLSAGFTVFRVWFNDAAAKEIPYQFGEVRRGDLESTVTATGTLSALETVAVGTQVSGTVAQVLVDFNDRVKKDQLLAVIDPELLDASIRDAQAEIQRMQAQLDQARSVLNRNKPLADQGIISRNELMTHQTAVRTAQASMVSAQTSLARAQKNRQNAEIRSPIDGIVIERTADVGQTVAASLQAPTLFTIAQDLAQMEILVNVDESDVGQIAVGQPVRFKAASFPDQEFEGVAQQVRLQPKTVQNVVNYTVVVQAQNPKGVLLPGMTATVEFIVQKVEDTLLVPASALSFRPTEAMLKDLREQRNGPEGDNAGAKEVTENTQASAGQGSRRRGDGQRGAGQRGEGQRGEGRRASGDRKRVWLLNPEGKLQVVNVKTGATDGFTTQIEPLNGELEPGARIITGVTSSNQTAQNRTTSPFAQGGNQRGGGRGMRF